ncbi:MAG: hypothetical protein JHC95_00160 [Solirubrobacteraceae bacterium]|nr:hypothetical protein [Solirubrobacteraceae bacterium]
MIPTRSEEGTTTLARGSRRRSRLIRALTAALALTAVAAPSALADDAGVPDPLKEGPRTVKKVEYEAGTLLLNLPTAGATVSVPMRGSIHYPTGPGLSKIIVFVHGRHGICVGSLPSGTLTCPDEDAPDGTPVTTDIRSYGGYDYMADNLASHGYLVMSIEANVTNFDNGYSDAGANARSQIIQGSLNLLFRWNNGKGPIVVGQDDHTIGTKLVGKANFAEGIGLMGHSRGGDAVTDYITYNAGLSSGSRYPMSGVLALAPTNYTANKTPVGTNYAVLLPACDGDVSTLQGARLYENSKYAGGNANFAKVQFYVEGTNHNFFNTTWTGDDNSNATDAACSRQQTATTKRLTPADQRRVGQGIMNSFLRRYVGNEKAFDPMMTGEVTLPETAKALESGVDLADEVKTSYVGPVTQRLDVLRPTPSVDPLPDPLPAMDPDALTKTAQGGPLTATGLKLFNVCRPAAANGRGLPSLISAYPTCPADGRNRAVGTQFTVAWDAPSSISAALGADGATKDVSKFGALDLRMAFIREDALVSPAVPATSTTPAIPAVNLNPTPDGYTPSSAKQDFDVTLVDANGNKATTNAAKWGKAVQSSIGTRIPHNQLNGLRIPMEAFTGVDLTKITSVEFGFGGRTATGAIQLADVMFQESAKPAAPVVDTPAAPVPPSPEPTLVSVPAPVPAAGSTATCAADTFKPTTTVTGLSLTRTSISVKGISADKGCPEGKGVDAGGVKRTVVEISRSAGKGLCQFVGTSGKLRTKSACDIPFGLYAKKATEWSLSIKKAKLPKGTYSVRVKTFDKAGNLTTLKVKKVSVA